MKNGIKKHEETYLHITKRTLGRIIRGVISVPLSIWFYTYAIMTINFHNILVFNLKDLIMSVIYAIALFGLIAINCVVILADKISEDI